MDAIMIRVNLKVKKMMVRKANPVVVTKWGGFGKGHGQFNHPASIDNDPNGQRFYIADLDNNRVQVLHGDGSFITEWERWEEGMGSLTVLVQLLSMMKTK